MPALPSPQSAIRNPQFSNGRSTNSTRNGSRSGTRDRARAACLKPAQFQLADRAHFGCRGTTSPALVVGGVHHHRECRDVRALLSWLSNFHGCRHLGKQHPGWLGLGHHELRFLDRYWTCRDPHLCHLVFASAKMAYVDQPLGGGDDALCRHLRRDFPRSPCGACLDGMVFGANPKQLGDLAKFPQRTDVGRVCGVDVLHGVSPILVHRFGPRSGDAARSS